MLALHSAPPKRPTTLSINAVSMYPDTSKEKKGEKNGCGK